MDLSPIKTRTAFLDLADEEFETEFPASEMPERIGEYRVLREVGRGGMGTVYEAEQDKPARRVALKVMNFGLTRRSLQRRFEYEAQVLATLRHPGIAAIYSAGTHAPTAGDRLGPAPFFAMEYIEDALPITDYAAEKQLSRRGRLELFAKVCDAVHHGHLQGVIHRDLKPANLLIDANGQSKVIDFGVARSTELESQLATRMTEVGQLVGTVQYMSPEQCDADPSAIDARSDLYALGIVLYELLADQLPYDIRKAQIHEATRVIREAVPPRLSDHGYGLGGDLETIVHKLLEKDKELRYASAAELAADLRRYLRHEPISARPPSVGYQIRKFARRNPGLTAAVGALFLVLAVSLGWISCLYLKVEGTLQAKIAAEQAAVEQGRIASEAQAELAGLRAELRAFFDQHPELLEERLPMIESPRSPAPVRGVDTRRPAEVEATLTRVNDRLQRLELVSAGHPDLQMEIAEHYELLGDAWRAAQMVDGVIPSSDESSQGGMFYRRSLDLSRAAKGGAARGGPPSDRGPPQVVRMVIHADDGEAGDLGSSSSASSSSDPLASRVRPAAFGLWQDDSEEDPHSWRMKHLEGRVLAKVEELELAEASLEESRAACEAFVFDSPLEGRVAAELVSISLDLGEVKLGLGDCDGAREMFEAAATIPAEGRRTMAMKRSAANQLIALCSAEGDGDQALHIVETIVGDAPVDADGLRLLAEGYLASGQRAEARAYGKRALEALADEPRAKRRERLRVRIESSLADVLRLDGD